VLSRAGLKELAHDYLERNQVNELRPVTSAEHVIEQNTATPVAVMTAVERLRQRSDQVAKRLAMEREREQVREALEQQHTPEQRQRHTLEQKIAKQRELDHDHGLEL
jgi:gamma-glutamyl:cysteine ligase YbdK (ATP-grasp superfamily)